MIDLLHFDPIDLLGNQGSTAAPTSLFNTSSSSERKHRTGKNKRTKLKRSKHSRFTWFGLRAYVHGGKEGVYSLSVERVTNYNAIGILL